MAVSFKCAGCGAEVEFASASPTEVATCPGCTVRVRRRSGDSQMAIPVSMDLPEEFRQVDLNTVANKSDLLVGRYRKTAEPESSQLTTDLVLARALETLAHSIQNLEERLDAREQAEVAPQPERREPGTNGTTGGRNGQGTPAEEVVHLGVEQQDAPAGQVPAVSAPAASPAPAAESAAAPAAEVAAAKASPVEARVLCRREAAKEAHAFRREKHRQADWDDRSDHSKGSGGFGWLMERYPKSTVLITSLGAMAIIVFTILGMEGFFGEKPVELNTLAPVDSTPLGDRWKADPELGQAETVARGFLNATSASAAAPFVYESQSIGKVFERDFTPISAPDDYTITFGSDQNVEAGRIFAFDVAVADEPSRKLVVLREGPMPKVFWQFFAEVGEMSWDTFMSSKPSEPTLMRVWASKSNDYLPPYNKEEWQCYLLFNSDQSHRVHAYVKRGSGPDWQLSNALENNPERYGRTDALLAQVKLVYMSETAAPDGGRLFVAQIREVPSTSWLPDRFVNAP